MTQSQDSFEKAYARLEQILEKMNTGTLALEDSLNLYAEADQLITSCSSKLNDAERKIEMLMKQRSGEVALDEQGKPLKQEFQTSASSPLKN